MWDSLRLATCVFNMWLLLANIPRLLVALTTITTNRGHSTIMFGSLLIYHWPVNIPIDDCNMSICCSSTDHPPLMTSKVIPPKKCSVWYVLPHISERNPETSSNMAITCSYIKCQHLSTPYQPFATSATNANTSSFYPKHGCSKHPRCNPREAIIYLQWAGATLPIERSYGKSPWFLAPCHLPNGHLSIAFHSYVELCWMPETKHVFCESSSKSPRPSIKSC